MPKGKRQVLDREHMVQMLADPEFYAQCSHFLWLRNTALKTYEKYKEKKKRCCPDFSIMLPVVTAFFENLKELKQIEPEALDRVKRYLEKRKKKQIATVVIYYRSSRKQSHPAKLTF